MLRLRTPLNLALLGIGLLATIAGLVLIPADAAVAIRWGIDGKVTETAPKFVALVQMPAAVVLLWGIFWLIRRNGNADRRPSQTATLNAALTILTAVLVAVQVAIVVIAR